MTSELITVADVPGRSPQVHDVAAEFARLLAVAGVRTLPADAAPTQVLAGLAEPGVEACVLPVGAPADDTRCWLVAARADKPVVLVPPRASMHRPHVKRALLPLDGSPETSRAVRETALLLDRAGVHLVVLHVFDTATVPKFWDQRAHAHEAWSSEFTNRTGTPAGAHLQVRSGRAAAHVVEAAEAEDVDLIVMEWSRTVRADRARTVRESVAEALVPVLLLPAAPVERRVSERSETDRREHRHVRQAG